jgi:hypothetical protein
MRAGLMQLRDDVGDGIADAGQLRECDRGDNFLQRLGETPRLSAALRYASCVGSRPGGMLHARTP